MFLENIHFNEVSDCPIYGEWFTAQWADLVAPSMGICILSNGEFPQREITKGRKALCYISVRCCKIENLHKINSFYVGEQF